jgi:hypothetical protein
MSFLKRNTKKGIVLGGWEITVLVTIAVLVASIFTVIFTRYIGPTGEVEAEWASQEVIIAGTVMGSFYDSLGEGTTWINGSDEAIAGVKEALLKRGNSPLVQETVPHAGVKDPVVTIR